MKLSLSLAYLDPWSRKDLPSNSEAVKLYPMALTWGEDSAWRKVWFRKQKQLPPWFQHKKVSAFCDAVHAEAKHLAEQKVWTHLPRCTEDTAHETIGLYITLNVFMSIAEEFGVPPRAVYDKVATVLAHNFRRSRVDELSLEHGEAWCEYLEPSRNLIEPLRFRKGSSFQLEDDEEQQLHNRLYWMQLL